MIHSLMNMCVSRCGSSFNDISTRKSHDDVHLLRLTEPAKSLQAKRWLGKMESVGCLGDRSMKQWPFFSTTQWFEVTLNSWCAKTCCFDIWPTFIQNIINLIWLLRLHNGIAPKFSWFASGNSVHLSSLSTTNWRVLGNHGNGLRNGPPENTLVQQ